MAGPNVKRQLGLPKDFYFPIGNITRFITAKPHAPHKIDFEEAVKVYREITSGVS
jgi:hypothetical protein